MYIQYKYIYIGWMQFFEIKYLPTYLEQYVFVWKYFPKLLSLPIANYITGNKINVIDRYLGGYRKDEPLWIVIC